MTVIKSSHFNYRIYCYASNHFVTSVSFAVVIFLQMEIFMSSRCE